SNSDINFLLIAILLIFISFITQTLKWFTITKIQLTNISFIEAFKVNIMSMFYGFITPSRIGGIIRAEYLRKYNNNNLGKGVSNYVLDKVLDLGSLAFLAGLFSLMFKDLVSINYFYYSLSGFILIVILLMIFRDEKRSRSTLRIIYVKLVPEKMKEKVKNGFNSFYQDMPKKRYFILFFLLNVLNWVVLYASTFFIGISLGIDISFYYFLAILPIATLIGQIPITISGLGTREAVMISLFGVIGISATKVFSMSLISIFLAGVIPALIGSFLIFKNKEK
ncbi:MAG: lysylphosphatidylglycerol synthase transmembrane domain-containing protein, partial [Candidatus Pacearchaeota archaeon]|nr:lysylphosphatidylglycerol synthase transmembrane domain-containing protein [Candidatus Pacearchaeota archaeon]